KISFEEACMMANINEDKELIWDDLDIETKSRDTNSMVLEPESKKKTKTLSTISRNVGDRQEYIFRIEEENELYSLDICYAHFMFNQKLLHSTNIKKLYNQNIQAPCVGSKFCTDFPSRKLQENELSDDKFDEYQPCFICSECFNSE
ncbi:2078_t:CDS:2, partial [Racocetra persica]